MPADRLYVDERVCVYHSRARVSTSQNTADHRNMQDSTQAWLGGARTLIFSTPPSSSSHISIHTVNIECDREESAFIAVAPTIRLPVPVAKCQAYSAIMNEYMVVHVFVCRHTYTICEAGVAACTAHGLFESGVLGNVYMFCMRPPPPPTRNRSMSGRTFAMSVLCVMFMSVVSVTMSICVMCMSAMSVVSVIVVRVMMSI